MNKKFIAKISAVFLAFIVGFGAPATALAADTGGGIGGGGSNGSWTGPIYWKSIAYNDSNSSNQKTWKKFLSETANPNSEVESQVRGRVGNLEVCKKSKVIWYINHQATNNWVFNFGYKPTHGKEWNEFHNNVGDSTIEKPHIKINRAPTDAEVAAFKEWDKQKNGTKINKKPGYTVICSGAFLDQPDEYFKKIETDSKGTNSKNIKEFNEPYSFTTNVKPQFLEGATSDIIGEPNLVPQKGKAQKTNYGILWDKVNNDGLKLTPAQLKTAVNDALEKDKKMQRGLVTLNKDNKDGMAEGGILNVYEYTQFAKLSSSTTTNTKKVQECTYVKKWNSKKQQYNAPVKVSCVPKNSVSTTSDPTMTSTMGTLKNTGFYQMISVHCNPEDFQALVNSDPSKIKVTSGSKELVNGRISASAVTTVYRSTNNKKPEPNILDFGDADNTNAAKKATSQLGFYDKECGFECTPDSKSSNAQANGAKDNIELGGKTVEGNRTGVSTSRNSGTVNSNNLEFFRDNDKNQVKVDLWYPKRDGKVVMYDGEQPITTTVSRWEEGTPHPQSTKGGKFTMTSAKNNEPLFTGNDEVKVQKNWDNETFNNANSTILTGKHDTFYLSSTWASENAKPQVLNIKYEYAPTVNSRIYTNNIGFGANGVQNLGSASNVSTEIQGKCYVNYRSSADDKQLDTTQLFSDNTGTGSTNNLDGKIVEGAGSVSESKDKQTNLVVNFVRSTTE